VLVEMALAEYVKDVREGRFPCHEYTYSIKAEELAAVSQSRYWAPTNGTGVAAGADAAPGSHPTALIP
jgi:hypothetical protein